MTSRYGKYRRVRLPLPGVEPHPVEGAACSNCVSVALAFHVRGGIQRTMRRRTAAQLPFALKHTITKATALSLAAVTQRRIRHAHTRRTHTHAHGVPDHTHSTTPHAHSIAPEASTVYCPLSRPTPHACRPRHAALEESLVRHTHALPPTPRRDITVIVP